MNSNHFSKAGRFFKIILFFFAVTLFSFCTTYDKVSSSFGKRKYTKGHFFDPVAKVKTAFQQGGHNETVTTEANAGNTLDNNGTLAKTTTTKEVKVNFTARPSTIAANDNKHKAVEETTTIAKNSTTNAKDNISIKESSSNDPYVGQSNHVYHHDDSKQGTYLIAWLVCLALSLVLILLIVSWSTSANNTSGSGYASTGCILGLLLLFTVVGAIVFFILWVVALSGS